MKPDIQRELIPRDDTVHLIGALNAMKDKLLEAAQQWELLDESGHVPTAPSYTTLLQHAADAQDISRDVLRLTADFARSPHSTTRAGSAVLAHLATAATMSSHAAPHFTETAESALSLPRPSNPTDGHYLKNRMVIDHARRERSCGARRNLSATRPRNSTTTSNSTASSRRSPLGKARRLHRPGRAVVTARQPRRTDITTSGSPLNRPAHFSDADWAEYQHCQTEHDDLTAQVAECEAQMEHDLIATYDEY